jgi:hypothetical protein
VGRGTRVGLQGISLPSSAFQVAPLFQEVRQELLLGALDFGVGALLLGKDPPLVVVGLQVPFHAVHDRFRRSLHLDFRRATRTLEYHLHAAVDVVPDVAVLTPIIQLRSEESVVLGLEGGLQGREPRHHRLRRRMVGK